jgi:AraC-like DNA-binding protein/TolB-like protein
MDGGRQLEPNGSVDQTVLPRHVRLALAYLNASFAEKITLSDVVSACATSERTLLKHFQKYVGLPPVAYLRRLRLNVVRQELLKAGGDEAISDVAIRCGYPHLGRFAGDYRRLFGEAPSATRQRVRLRVADRALAGNGTARFDSPIAVAWRERPSLLILQLRTETLQESREARDLTERLSATLSRMGMASVALASPSRSLSMNAAQPRNAGTQYCLMGRLTRHGERTRVIVRLADVAADRHVWGDSFDGSANDPFALQDRVVDGALCGVVSNIFQAEMEQAHNKDPKDLAVHDLAMQALMLILRTNVPSARKAMAILDHAIELDPANALSVALLACGHAQLATYHGTSSPAAARDMALRLALQARMLDSNDPLVTTARGTAAAMSLQSDEGDALVSRALAMDPSSTWVWERRALLRVAVNPDGAIADFIRALRLRAPTMPRSNCLAGIAAAHYSADRLAETDLWMRKALAENPEATWLYCLQTRFAFKLGGKPMVKEAVERLRRAQPELTVSYMVASFPLADPDWLDALACAGMPL